MRLERTREALRSWARIGEVDEEPGAIEAALAEVEQAEAVIAAARVRTKGGHADTCGLSLGVYPCSCGQEALASALAAFGSGEGDMAQPTEHRRDGFWPTPDEPCGWDR